MGTLFDSGANYPDVLADMLAGGTPRSVVADILQEVAEDIVRDKAWRGRVCNGLDAIPDEAFMDAAKLAELRAKERDLLKQVAVAGRSPKETLDTLRNRADKAEAILESLRAARVVADEIKDVDNEAWITVKGCLARPPLSVNGARTSLSHYLDMNPGAEADTQIPIYSVELVNFIQGRIDGIRLEISAELRSAANRRERARKLCAAAERIRSGGAS